METFKGKVRRIFNNGKRVHIARSHSLCEIGNEILDLKIGDIVLGQWNKTVKKTGKNQTSLQKYSPTE
ncbi:MAG TPA: hypothetical protein VI977_04835 [archaeon]|nr:hypothetical protein [archaeon]